MGKKLRRIFSVLLSVLIVLSNLGMVGATEGATPLIEKSNIAIASGTVYDLSAEPGAGELYSLRDATIYIEYQSTSSEQYQSLFSVSNPGTANDDMYRHFHLYVTPTGTLGMELRNTDSDFKYTMSAAGAVTHGAQNRIAFKADSQSKTYKLFANGQMVGELSKDDYRFFADILGLSNASLGGTIRNGEVDYPFAGTVSNVQVYTAALSDAELINKTYVDTSLPVMEQSNVDITPGSYVDLSNEANAEIVKHLREGTIVISFTTTSTAGVQSLFSVGNSTSGNQDRHFHIYLTNTGALGMELRNTDLSFKYTMSRPAVLDGLDHGAPAVNTVAFKADADSHTYKLFANGDLITTLEEDDWKFISDIAGVNNIALGATIRNGTAAYPYGGTIQDFAVYTQPLSDEALLEMTGATAHGTKIFYAGDGTGSNYYRIPTLLTLESGVVVSSIDTRYGGTHDARSNIDIGFSRSTDGGKTWSAPTLPLVFDDYAPQAVEWPRDLIGKNIQISGSASFIDTVLLEDRETGRLFLFSDAFTSGKGFNNVVGGTGFKEINGVKYLKLHKSGDLPTAYNYSIRENGVIYDDTTGQPTQYAVDGDYRIMQNGEYLTQKQYNVHFEGLILKEEQTDVDVKQCVFYKDSLFQLLPTNYLVYKYSDDEGLTWSDMKILGDFRDVNSRMVLFGPGVGTQIQNGPYAGRLIISSYNSVSGDYGYLYSDDHGATWSFVNTDLGGSGTFAEAQIIEFPDGTLQTYMRAGVGKIAYITSVDGGMTWSPSAYLPDITVASYGTQLSVIRHSQMVDGKSVILLSTPTASDGRRGGKILVGLVTDTGGTGYDKYTVSWDYAYEVDLPAYGFSYSCMTELPDGQIGILYEKYDSWSRDELHLKNIMRYDIFTLSELMQE
ncbi:sialidase domain-containing protein [Candidatus Avoscillospira sp. LCP25S3_F1]|uniref:sialidase domain-containing protein n=1 Tax=Candidatus Avoscillospira sp. LCP25S3_F1 TaxID=3438825 RepID=UPI003F8E3AEF